MRKAFIFALLIIMCSFSVQSQVTLGLGGLIQNTSLAGDDPTDGFLRSGIGFGVSAFASIGLSSDIDLFVQPGWDTRQTKLSYNKTFLVDGQRVDSTIDSSSMSSNYISIPIGVRIFNTKHNWFFSTGASFNLLQSAEVKVQDSVTLTDPHGLLKEDVMLFAGAGYILPLGPVNLTFEARYQLGLIDIVDEANSEAFVRAPIIRQSGLLFNVSLEVPLGDRPASVEDTTQKSNIGPRMGEHLFSLISNGQSPFVRTVTTFTIGGGQSMNIDFPILKINDNITLAPSGNILAMSILAKHEQKIKDWISFHAYLTTVARIGTNVTSLLSQGVNSVIGFGMGWNIRIVESEKLALTGGLDLRQSDITNVNLNRWIEGVIDSGKVTADNPLVDTKPTLRAVMSMRGAWAFNRTFGAVAIVEGGYGESSTRDNFTSLALSTTGYLSIDLNPTTDVPLGITAGAGYRQSPEAADGTSEESRFVMLRIGQTGTEHFALGAQLTWIFTSLTDIDPSLSIIAVGLDMKFYY